MNQQDADEWTASPTPANTFESKDLFLALFIYNPELEA